MIKKKKSWNVAFAKFFESPSREGLRDLLHGHLGETHAFDFKEIWPFSSKLSRLILGLANYGGGCLIIGVQENDDKSFTPVGLNELSDKTKIQKGIEKFIPMQLEYEIAASDTGTQHLLSTLFRRAQPKVSMEGTASVVVEKAIRAPTDNHSRSRALHECLR